MPFEPKVPQRDQASRDERRNLAGASISNDSEKDGSRRPLRKCATGVTAISETI